jgi:Zn-dependent protease with chaperone function
MRRHAGIALSLLAVLAPAWTQAQGQAKGQQPRPKQEEVEGYAEWRGGGILIVDGQRVRPAPGSKFKGDKEAKSFDTIPLGYEVKAKGLRAADGALVAAEVQAKRNGSALFEKEVLSATNAAESSYKQAGRFYQEGNGRQQTIGRLYESGPQWERARRIVDDLVPPYMDPDDVRVYVIENPEWNAFAMGNYSVYVFSGLLDDMDDDEVALVLGHEIAHATHEHTRRQFKKAMWIQIAALGVAAAAEEIDDKTARAVVQLATLFGATAYSNGYGRNLEDQADRVGMRYAYEAGYDIGKGPRLWQRFAQKYGQPGKVANFFFGDHSLASARAARLERELAFNYPEGPKEGGVRAVRASAGRAPVGGRGTTPAAAPALAAAPAARPQGSAALAPGPANTPAVAAPAAPAPAPPAGTQRRELKPGMTPDEVRKLLGKPKEETVFGNRTRWSYPDLSVIFEDGRVKEVKF